jgi:dolichol-phosphate mannosyltransferase
MYRPTAPAALRAPTATLTTPRDAARNSRDSLVIIPTYNEVENLATLVPKVLAQGPFHVLVVDDNSPDGTGVLAEYLATVYPGRVMALHRPGKLGLGTAYLQGFRYALEQGYERIFEMDADFSHDPAALPRLRNALDESDVVLGSRYVRGGGTRRWPRWRKLISRTGSSYSALVLGLPLHDLTGGFKGFRRHVLEALDLDSIRSNGYSFQIEVTHRAHRLGFRIMEAPIIFEDRRFGRSKMSARIIAEALVLVWRLRFSPPQFSEARA